MYIKFVRIQGFKSYRDKVTCGPLSPMHNSIVGMNGSGKSNFFAALQFVLSDAYSNLRAEERAKLLNEGAGAPIVSAHVEIVFDNSDHRLDNEKDEVTIRRQIGLKKDEFFIDTRHVQKAEIANLLETAGFSKSNPYYIVEQGKVFKITEMKDKARLELLKEVAGTNVYEEKKEESLKIMKESDSKMTEIKKNLDMIEDRLAKLDAEKEELSQYYNLDKDRRSLQHAILTQKTRELHEGIQALEHERNTLRTNSSQAGNDRAKSENQIIELERKIETLSTVQKNLQTKKETLEAEEKLKSKAVLKQELIVQGQRERFEKDSKEQESKKAEKSRLQSEIKKLHKKKESLEPVIAAAQEELERLAEEYDKVDREMNKLSSVRSNAQQFKSKADRDQYLKSQIKDLDSNIKQREDTVLSLENRLGEAQERVQMLVKERDEINERYHQFKESRQQFNAKKDALSTQRIKCTEAKFAARSELDLLKTKLENFEAEHRSLSASLSNIIPAPAYKALRFLRRFVETEKIQGFYGPVIDLFECQKNYNTAVEQVGGARLFNIVVEDDKVATRLLTELQKRREGRTQFLPLSKLKPEVVRAPHDRPEAVPLINCLRFESKFKPAMEEVFGKTLLCENADKAADCRRSLNVACVTLDGDKYSKKGSIKGGYHDTSRSQISINKQIKAAENALSEIRNDEARWRQKLNAEEQADAALEGELAKLERDTESSFRNFEKDGKSLDIKKREISDAEMFEQDTKRQVKSIREDIQQMKSQRIGFKEQLDSPFAQTLTQDQEANLNTLTGNHTQLQMKLASVQKDLDKNVAVLASYEQEIRSKTDADEAIDADIDKFQTTIDGNWKFEEATLRTLQAEADAVVKQKEAVEAEMDANAQELENLTRKRKKVKDELRKFESDVESSSKKLDSLLQKKGNLMNELDKAQSQIRELGSLPQAHEKYKSKDSKYLHSELAQVTEKLRAFKDVNKKALDQFNQFTAQREEFRKRRDELEKGADSIRELITKLDEQKDEAIQNTFRMVARNFKEVFKTLVPGGSGELIMKTSDRDGDDDGDDVDEDDDGAARTADRARKYAGVAVKVRFATGGEVHAMRTLSGGQKTVVALAIIFAIQKCDPAPFYLFDEVDANLDPMYRSALAKMISKQKDSPDGQVQFITSSFQPELAQVADKHFITTHSGMSRVVEGSIEDQIAIIRENQKNQTVTQGP